MKKVVLALMLLSGCTKDHRAPDAENNVHGKMVALLGCSSGIRAGSTTFLIGSQLDSFPGYDPQKGTKVVFSYTERHNHVGNVCNIDASSIKLTALRNE